MHTHGCEFVFIFSFFFKIKKYMCCVFKKMQKTTAGPELGLRWGMAYCN